MLPRTTPAPIWFASALVPMIASQIVRLHQHDAAAWILWDYFGRIGGIAILAAIPSAREVPFRRERLEMALWKTALWIACIVATDQYFGSWARQAINMALPATVLGAYPQPGGWLHLIDLTCGLMLVAYSEETTFRRCARHVFQSYVGDGLALISITSLLFGAYHWWAGFGNILEATVKGVLLMLFFQRSGALWPVVLTTLWIFSTSHGESRDLAGCCSLALVGRATISSQLCEYRVDRGARRRAHVSSAGDCRLCGLRCAQPTLQRSRHGAVERKRPTDC